jgi:hypothetical protein
MSSHIGHGKLQLHLMTTSFLSSVSTYDVTPSSKDLPEKLTDA